MMGQVTPDDDHVLLPADVDPDPELGDHPDAVTDDEAAEGQNVYQQVDDTDDQSNGLDQ